LWCAYFRCGNLSVFHHPGLQPLAYQAHHTGIADAVFYKTEKPFMAYRVEESGDIGVQYPALRFGDRTEPELAEKVAKALLAKIIRVIQSNKDEGKHVADNIFSEYTEKNRLVVQMVNVLITQSKPE
jgi:hypothetical protein